MKKKLDKILNKKIVLLIVSILTVVIILMNSTYSLLADTKTTDLQSYTTGILEISSSTTNNSVTLTNGVPMTDEDGANSIPYTFKIQNTGNLTYKFDVKLLSTTATNLIDAQYIKIKVNDNPVQTLSSLTDGKILEGITLNPDENVEVTLRVWLDYNTPNSQIGKVFNAKIVTEGFAQYTKVYTSEEVLANLGLTLASGTPRFNYSSCSSGCGEATVGVYSAPDDLGTSYYFRGSVTNNYVKFGTNASGQDMYWRIIRINGDGTVRMIYDGTQAYDNGTQSIDRQVGTSAFNTSTTDNAYVGYMYGTPGQSTYEATHANINNSAIKTFLEGTGNNDGWYYNNIVATGYDKYVADAIYCNDRSLYSGTGIGTSSTMYGAYNRINTNKQPTLKCTQPSDRFTILSKIRNVTGNGNLRYPVGLITADEVSYGGIVFSGSNYSYYLNTGNNYWTSSSFNYGNMIIVLSGAFNYSGVSSTYGVRPVISLKPDAIKGGNGSKTNPFTVSEVTDAEFAYGTSTQTFKVSKSGTYKLEAWGAQGDDNESSYSGGKGGYISGTISLNQGDVLTITTGGQDGTNGGGKLNGVDSGGGATTIKLNGTTILTAAGGGAAGGDQSGNPGGSGNGAGGVSVGEGDGVAGTNGGGGSASPYYEFDCVETDECGAYDYSACHPYSGNGCFWGYYPGDDYCYVKCVSDVHGFSWDGEYYSTTFDAPCSGYVTDCSIYWGKPGNGGTSSIGTGVTLVTKTDGNNEGNGHAKISFVS